MTDIMRCDWAKDDIEQKYHDMRWGKPVHNDYELFYMLILEGFQAGLSWITILRKWNSFFEAFDNFDVNLIITYDEKKIESLMQDTGIIRNRRKIESTITNAIKFIDIQTEFGSFDDYIWRFVDFSPIKNSFHSMEEVPASTPLSEKISRDLKKRGFKFIGPTIIYAYMQSIGMVNDHLTTCFCYDECDKCN